MKKNILIGVILMSICIVCAALISSVNLFTKPIIDENNVTKENNLCKKIFKDYDNAKETITDGFSSDEITKLVIACDNSNEVLGYIYTVSGKNAYGEITLLVGINTNKELVSIEFMTNGQSFSSETANHVKNNYVAGITNSDVDNIDTACGATFGAKLVKELVGQAFTDVATREAA